MKATIQERGNGFPQVGDFVAGADDELYLVVSIADRIFTGNATAGEPNYVYAEVEIADWDDVTDDNEPVCTAIIQRRRTYMIVDGNDNQIADGISEETIESVAQSHADRLGETVYYVESIGEDGEYVAVEPTSD